MADTYYDSAYTGLEIDEAVGAVLNPDTTPTEDSTELITSGGVYNALSGISGGGGIPFGVCSTAAATQAKTVDIAGVTELTAGLTILVLFGNSQSYNGTPTLNVNSLGAKDIYAGSGAATQYAWGASEAVLLTYYNNHWVMEHSRTATTTYYGATKLSSSTSSTSTTLAATPSAVKAAYDLANGKQDALTSGTNIKTVGGQSLLSSGDVPIALPIVAQSNIAWNTAFNFGTLNANKSVTIPALPSGVTGEIRLTATQPSGGSYKITLTAPSGVTITDGTNSGSSLEITPTGGKHIEISAAVVDTVISVLTNEV